MRRGPLMWAVGALVGAGTVIGLANVIDIAPHGLFGTALCLTMVCCYKVGEHERSN